MQVKINNQHKDICLHKSMEIMRREGASQMIIMRPGH